MPAVPPIITLDTVETATLNLANVTLGGVTQFARPFWADAIDIAPGTNKSEALWIASEAVQAAAAAHPLDASRADLIITRIMLEGVTDTSARGRIIYETPQFGAGAPPSTYLIRDAGFGRTAETIWVPGTREPLNCTWTDTGSTSGAGSVGDFFPDTITDVIPYQIPMQGRALGINALIYGRPTNGQQYISCVNDAVWPGAGSGYTGASHGKGFWKLDQYVTDYARYSGYFTLQALASSKVIEDWSELGRLRNAQTGRYVSISTAEVTAIMALPYIFGIRNGNGFQRVGFFPLVSFPSIFGW